MDKRKIVACFFVLWYLNIVTWLMMWFMMNHNSARRRNRELALRNSSTKKRKRSATNDNDLAVTFKEMLSESIDKLDEVLQAAFGKGVDPKLEIASELSKMNLSIDDQIKALNILFGKLQNEKTFMSLDGAMKKSFVLMLLRQSNRN